jgi:hypothetical protein
MGKTKDEEPEKAVFVRKKSEEPSFPHIFLLSAPLRLLARPLLRIRYGCAR